jgi:hypothetical protein
VKRSTILLGPFQRADVVVNFAGELGKRIVLKSVARTDSPPAGSIDTPPVSIMQFRVTRSVSDATRVPSTLEAPPALSVPSEIGQTWSIGLDQTAHKWTINGQAFDPGRIDYAVTRGTTEKWQITNDSPITHFVHLHEEQWQTILRDGQPPKPWERGIEDTWKLDPGESIVVAARFTDYDGPFMIHCHMLDHEDDGLMADFEVVAPGASTNPAAYTHPQHMAGMRQAGLEMAMTMPMGSHAAADSPATATHGGSPFLTRFAVRLACLLALAFGVWLLQSGTMRTAAARVTRRRVRASSRT